MALNDEENPTGSYDHEDNIACNCYEAIVKFNEDMKILSMNAY